MKFENNVAIITGASSGIGLATAKLLASQGMRVALVSRDNEKLQELAKQLPGSLAVPADMTKPADIKSMVAKVYAQTSRIDILINSAGQGYDAPIEKTNIETLRHIFELDLLGPILAMQAVIPVMRTQGHGIIINISSGTALMHLPNMGGYSGLKAALAGMSLTARAELAKDNIVVSVVYPYSTLTEFENHTIKDFVPAAGPPPFPPDTAEFVAQKILDGMISGQPEIFAHEWMDPARDRQTK